ncbi:MULTISPECIES: GatB/YqeY domain-containing protein [unclassified Sphingomonas]|uniref:GatB/YqeY domain-containing protein n=1 Tax=unclassified Sphingomonas TaxID=196159 RepID=UPI0006FDBE98|nr:MULTISPECIES: GatB/YqeY domain-containing protein [unclassified Sphingomonas]KQX20004.1 aspartyl-tRNA amidotransferase [Sphingomonas sp. Root1294]KQY67253.1 aspartyl-tRNA amidotransferase [Sphingomonas sp. Root50]KRB90627.1 aspartyl-tRNA amidotransferase [Sphingomonas sp. Root720]
MIRDEIKTALVAAMKARDATTTAAIRLIQSSIKNRDIELRTATQQPDDDLLVTEVLQKMIKQRRESIEMYEKGNRPELAAAEAAEVAVIERFLPQQMSEDEAKAAIDALATELGAASVKDMGRVMAAIKERFAGKMDMAKASGLVKARLG